MMTDPHIYTTYHLQKARLEAIHTAKTACCGTRQAQGEKPNRTKTLVEYVVAFVKRLRSRPVAPAQTVETPQIQLGNEQA